MGSFPRSDRQRVARVRGVCERWLGHLSWGEDMPQEKGMPPAQPL